MTRTKRNRLERELQQSLLREFAAWRRSVSVAQLERIIASRDAFGPTFLTASLKPRLQRTTAPVRKAYRAGVIDGRTAWQNGSSAR